MKYNNCSFRWRWREVEERGRSHLFVFAPSVPPFSLFSSHIVTRKPFPCPRSCGCAHTCTCTSVFVCWRPLGLLETRHGLPERPASRFGSKTCRSHYFFFYSQHIRWLSLASAFQSTLPPILVDSRTHTHTQTRTVSNDIKYPLKPCTHTPRRTNSLHATTKTSSRRGQHSKHCYAPLI